MSTNTDKAKFELDTKDAKAAIVNAQGAVKKLQDACIAARSFNPLKALGGVDTKLADALERLDDAAKRALPRAKKSKKKAA